MTRWLQFPGAGGAVRFNDADVATYLGLGWVDVPADFRFPIEHDSIDGVALVTSAQFDQIYEALGWHSVGSLPGGPTPSFTDRAGLTDALTVGSSLAATDPAGVTDTLTTVLTTTSPPAAALVTADTGATDSRFAAITRAVLDPMPLTDQVNVTQTSTAAATIDNNTSIGTGNNQVQYTGSSWTFFSGGGITFHYGFTTGDTATLRFTGTAITVVGVKEPNGGIWGYSLDGGAEQTVDAYAASQTNSVPLINLISLANTSHTLVIRVTGTKNVASGASVVDFQYATVTATTGGGGGGGGGGTGTAGARSGIPWSSGMWAFNSVGSGPGFTTAEKYQETQRGRLVDVVRGAQYANQWQDLAGNIPTFYGLQILDFLDDYANQVGGPIPVLMLPPWPSNISGTWAAAAAGTYNSQFQGIGASIANKRPTSTTYIELAWEANGTWYDWSISGPNSKSGGGAANFIAGWRNAVTQIRAGAGAAASHIKFVLTLSLLDSYAGDPLTVTYPGNAYVDVVGTDQYDWNPATTSDTVLARQTDMQRLYDFCVANGKQWALPEWGLHHIGSANEGGDNPHFIRATWAFCNAHKDILAYECYFQDDALNNVNSSLFSPNVNNNPNSRAAYLALTP